MKTVFALVLLCITPIAQATNYYVKNSGNDSSDGLSDATAWKTITHINTRTFYAGDSILFKRGDIWIVTQANCSDGISIKYSGSAGSRICFGAYGSGAKPVITGRQPVSGWNTAGNWTNVSGSIWSMTNGCTTNTYSANNRGRIWLNGTEAVKYPSNSSYTPTASYPWTHNGSTLYVYATSNPAGYYSNIESLGPAPVIVYCTGKYITISNLDIRGSGNLFQISGCDYLIVENCSIGYDSGQSGLITTYGGTASDNVIIRKNIFDTNDHTIDTYEMNNTEDGLIVSDGDDNWDIYGNTFIGWGHTGYNFGVTTLAATNIKFHNNISTCPYSDYGRAFTYNIQAAVGAGTCTGNEIYGNFFYNHPTHSQISGDGLKFYNNIIDGVRGATFRSGMSSGLVINAYAGPTDNNQIYNNVIMNASENGIYIVYSTKSTKNNLIKNNLVFNNALHQFRYEFSANSGASIGHNVINNNLFYKPGQASPVYYEKMASSGSRIMTVTALNAQNGTSANLYAGEVSDELTGNLAGDPLLVNATSADYLARNYHLSAGSPGIAAGISISGLSTDFESNTYSNPPNIGCYATPIVSSALSYISSVISNAAPYTVEMTYNLALANTVPAAASFTVLVNSFPRGINSVAINGTKVQLTLASAAVYGDIVTVSYNKPATNPLQTASGVQAASITTRAVINNVYLISGVDSLSAASPEGGKITIYPNPASSFINVSFEEPLPVNKTIKIFNLSGKIVLEEKLDSGTKDIQIPINLRTGVYIVNIGSGKLRLNNKKLIVSE